MTQTHSASREKAERAFDKTQSQALARNRIVLEEDAVTRARDEKTARLRDLRLAREALDAPTAAPKRTSGRKSGNV